MNDNVGSAKAEETNEPENTKKTTGRSASKRKNTEPSLNMPELRELADLVNEHGFTDFEFENENIRVRLSKNPAPQYIQAAPQYQTAPVSNAPAAAVSRMRKSKPKQMPQK